MKAKKLPSGSWRCMVYSHTDIIKQPDGTKVKKKRYKSFTCKDPGRAGKRKAEQMALEWLETRREKTDATIGQAVAKYIEAKNGVLSPSTIRAYKSYLKTHFEPLEDVSTSSPDVLSLQAWLSDLSETLSPKSVRCVYGLLTAAVQSVSGKPLNLTLPKPKKPALHTPTDAELKKLLDHVKGSELEAAIVLSAVCSLRRGEICALEASDLQGDLLTISKNMVRNEVGGWEIRQPKTPESVRTAIVPGIIKEFFSGKTGRVFDFNPDSLSKRFLRAVKSAGVEHFRFHDLRHYYASMAHALGIPDVYIMRQGGWKSDFVMKRVYRDAFPDRARTEAKKLHKHMNKLLR